MDSKGGKIQHAWCGYNCLIGWIVDYLLSYPNKIQILSLWHFPASITSRQRFGHSEMCLVAKTSTLFKGYSYIAQIQLLLHWHQHREAPPPQKNVSFHQTKHKHMCQKHAWKQEEPTGAAVASGPLSQNNVLETKLQCLLNIELLWDRQAEKNRQTCARDQERCRLTDWLGADSWVVRWLTH